MSEKEPLAQYPKIFWKEIKKLILEKKLYKKLQESYNGTLVFHKTDRQTLEYASTWSPASAQLHSR